MTGIETANRMMQQAAEKLINEVGTLIGEELEPAVIESKILPGPEFSRQLKDNVVLSRLEVSDGWLGEAFLVTGVETAIALGGKLIMLPAEELAGRLAAKNFDGELADAFSEIINIVTGSLNSVFSADNSRKLHFKKQAVSLEAVPLSTLGDSTYYLVSVAIGLNGEDTGPFWFLLAPAMLGMDDAAVSNIAPETTTVGTTEAGGSTPGGTPSQEPLVMIVAEKPQEGDMIAALLGKKNFQVLQTNIQENLREVVQGRNVRGVLLLMNKVSNQGIAAAIKLRSAMEEPTPIIAAGPDWTRESVLQVIKYGACDILISPISENDLLEKLQKYLD